MSSTSNSFEHWSSSASFGGEEDGGDGAEVKTSRLVVVDSMKDTATTSMTAKSKPCEEVIEISDEEDEEAGGGEAGDGVEVLEEEVRDGNTEQAAGTGEEVKPSPCLQKHVFMSSKAKKARAAALEVNKYPTVVKTRAKGLKRTRNGPTRLANMIRAVNERLARKICFMYLVSTKRM